jgi:hypothetical protein
MFKRTSRGAAVAASVSLALLAAVGTAKANIQWGNGTGSATLVSADTTSFASLRAFNQSNPVVVNEYGSIPKTGLTTQFASCLVENANGSQRVVLMLRYLDGSVYTIVSSDEKLATYAASKSSTISLTGKFYFATQAGQKVLRQTIYVNGAVSFIQWGNSASIVSAFTQLDGSCRNIQWGGSALLTESLDVSM